MQEQPIRERSNSIRSHDSAQSVAERTLHRSGSVTGHYSRGQGCDAVRRDGIATTGAKVHDPEENGDQVVTQYVATAALPLGRRLQRIAIDGPSL